MQGKLVRSLEGHAHRVNTLALSTEFVCRTGAYDHTGKEPASPAEAHAAARARYEAARLNGAERVVSGSDDFTIFLWNPLARSRAAPLHGPSPTRARSLADGQAPRHAQHGAPAGREPPELLARRPLLRVRVLRWQGQHNPPPPRRRRVQGACRLTRRPVRRSSSGMATAASLSARSWDTSAPCAHARARVRKCIFICAPPPAQVPGLLVCGLALPRLGVQGQHREGSGRAAAV